MYKINGLLRTGRLPKSSAIESTLRYLAKNRIFLEEDILPLVCRQIVQYQHKQLDKIQLPSLSQMLLRPESRPVD
jgi:hypothetical protein